MCIRTSLLPTFTPSPSFTPLPSSPPSHHHPPSHHCPPPHLHTIALLPTFTPSPSFTPLPSSPPSQHHQPLHLLHHFHITIALLPHIIIIFSSPSSDSLPSPECPLLDIKVILGDEGRYLTLMHLFKKELTSESFKPWKSVQWFTNE